jgi:DNA-binding CsgD family transcriptional regulator
LVAGRTEEALEIESSAREAAYASTDPAAWLRFEVPEAGLRYQALDFGRALDIVNGAVRHDHHGREDARTRLAHVLRSWILAALDRFDEALQVAEDGVVSAQRDRQNWALRVFEITRGRQMLQLGQFAEAAVALEGRFSLEDAHLVVTTLDAPSVVALGKLKISSGDERGALDVGEIAKIVMMTTAPAVRNHAAWLLACLSMSQGDPMQAHRWLCSFGYDERLELFPLFPAEMADDPQLVRIAAAAADEELATRVITMAKRRCELNPEVRSMRAVADHAEGIWYESAECLSSAVSNFEEGPRPLAYASALEDLGQVLLKRGDSSGAIGEFDRALSICSRVGANWDAARIRSRLRRLGVRKRPASADRPKFGWDSLTDTESAVAKLAADGHTNREIAERLFISPHTVNTHLRHVFEKLEINSRVALIRHARDRDQFSPSG